jgi:hypothetical protein
MSTDFRPVVETWGPHSSCFVETDVLERILQDLACDDFSNAGQTTVNDYGEVRSFWIENGARFLDFIDKYTVDQLIEMNSDWENIGPQDSSNADILSLFGNLKSLAPEWRNSLDPKNGSLTFYMDV